VAAWPPRSLGAAEGGTNPVGVSEGEGLWPSPSRNHSQIALWVWASKKCRFSEVTTTSMS
jgi:hypothetical protein